MYDQPSYDKAVNRIEKDFHDDDYIVRGTPTKSSRSISGYTGRNRTYDIRTSNDHVDPSAGERSIRTTTTYEKRSTSERPIPDRGRYEDDYERGDTADNYGGRNGLDRREERGSRYDADEERPSVSNYTRRSGNETRSSPISGFRGQTTERSSYSRRPNDDHLDDDEGPSYRTDPTRGANGRDNIRGRDKRDNFDYGERPSEWRDAPAERRDSPAARRDSPAARRDSPAARRDSPRIRVNDETKSGRGGGRSPAGGRVLYNGEAIAKDRERQLFEDSRGRDAGDAMEKAEETAFLGRVQRELESQRREWKSDIDRLTSSSLIPEAGTTFDALKNSVVDTSSGKPIFKAFVDVSEFPPSSIRVNVDKITNKVVIEAERTARTGVVAKTFTQRVQLPRFADEPKLVARMNKRGILKVEVPLIYYFPEDQQQDDSGKAKSFVYEVRTDPETGRKAMEILVNPGREISSRDLYIEMSDGDKLQIWGKKQSSDGRGRPEGQRTLIKQYTMPANADLDAIRTERQKDGLLAIFIPID